MLQTFVVSFYCPPLADTHQWQGVARSEEAALAAFRRSNGFASATVISIQPIKAKPVAGHHGQVRGILRSAGSRN